MKRRNYNLIRHMMQNPIATSARPDLRPLGIQLADDAAVTRPRGRGSQRSMCISQAINIVFGAQARAVQAAGTQQQRRRATQLGLVQ